MKKGNNAPNTPAIATGKPGIWHYVILLLAVIPVILHFKMINSFALNIPYNDDWDAILGFLNSWKHADQKLPLLFAQHNEHRILSSKIIYTSYFAVFNHINILSIIYIANMQLLVIAAVLAYFVKKVLNIPLFGSLMLFIISLCLFDPGSYDNSDFAMAGLQNYGVIMLFLLSLFFYTIKTKSRVELAAALLFQFLCAFSSGNGFMAGIALLLYTIFSKDKMRMICCMAGFALFTTIYFFTYHSVTNDMDIKAKSAGMFISYFLKLSGAHFSFEYGIVIAVLLYATIATALFYKRKEVELQRILPFLALLLFAGMSMAATALLRSGQANIFESVSISSRYLIYPQLLAMVFFILLAYRLQYLKNAWMALCLCSLIFVKAYRENYDYGASAFESRNTRLSLNKFVYPNKAHAQQVAMEACKNEIYCIEENRP